MNWKRKAGKAAELKSRILQTRKEANPLSAFCVLCRKLGYQVYEMDLACAGESFTRKSSAAPMAVGRIRRS